MLEKVAVTAEAVPNIRYFESRNEPSCDARDDVLWDWWNRGFDGSPRFLGDFFNGGRLEGHWLKRYWLELPLLLTGTDTRNLEPGAPGTNRLDLITLGSWCECGDSTSGNHRYLFLLSDTGPAAFARRYASHDVAVGWRCRPS